MKVISVACVVLGMALGLTASADSSRDHVLAKKAAITDLELQAKYAAQDESLRRQKGDLTFLGAIADVPPECEPSGGGSAACWKACTNEGYSSNTCANRCGTTTSGGSAACWKACGNEGYSSNTCANRCGTATHGGSEACWDMCTHEGNSSSTCANRCGTH